MSKDESKREQDTSHAGARPLMAYRNGADDKAGKPTGFALARMFLYCGLFGISTGYILRAVIREDAKPRPPGDAVIDIVPLLILILLPFGGIFLWSLTSLIQMLRGRKRFPFQH